MSLTKVPTRARQKTGEGEQSQEQKNAQRATRLTHEGQYTRALQSLTSAGMADHNRATVHEMTAKHPPAQHPSSFQSLHNVLSVFVCYCGHRLTDRKVFTCQLGSHKTVSKNAVRDSVWINLLCLTNLKVGGNLPKGKILKLKINSIFQGGLGNCCSPCS